MLHTLLQNNFGFSDFKTGQKKVISTILDGKSAIAIFPTGSGKSLCYQLPALQLPEITLVVSPLLALIKDQIDFLQSKNISAVRIDSSLSKEEEQEIMNGIRAKQHKILMISVERFKNERFRRFLKDIPISLLVVDEAHCISEWGHNFRPDYLKLPDYRATFRAKQVLLLTATATPKVIEDMSKKFDIAKEQVTITGFYRSNLHLNVIPVIQSEKNKQLLSLLLSRKSECGIVYVTQQKTAEVVASILASEGIGSKAYHAGLKSEDREEIQNQFMANKINCVVATIAFGMGIDKSNIRYIIHYDLPKSTENYSQEIGRAGRDGQKSDCIVLANHDNVNVLENFIFGDTPALSGIKEILSRIKKAKTSWEIKLNTLPASTNIRILPIKTLLVYMEIRGIIKPQYSYFADYRFSLNSDEKSIVEKFQGERKKFIQAIFDHSEKARKWTTVNFDTISQNYSTDRNRIISALEYFDAQRLINLEAKVMVDVFAVTNPDFDIDEVAQELYDSFKLKEEAEVNRIREMLSLFESETCISKNLANYFGEYPEWEKCGHCSVCNSGPVKIAKSKELKNLHEYNYQELCKNATSQFGDQITNELLAKFLCGINTPIFSRLKLKQEKHFSVLENYRFTDVLEWVKTSKNESI
ncbi:recombinase RecQ [Labilibaculum filiforme]|uniref:ATP-dependent DNA helicase RecQ n=2 Tax=Labilibaculum filiforme TaxID=1940526 RepID=A0A2N3I101_9BACT|nr:recombinase RecQ [Labilibaculum filiforme]